MLRSSREMAQDYEDRCAKDYEALDGPEPEPDEDDDENEEDPEDYGDAYGDPYPNPADAIKADYIN